MLSVSKQVDKVWIVPRVKNDKKKVGKRKRCTPYVLEYLFIFHILIFILIWNHEQNIILILSTIKLKVYYRISNITKKSKFI